MSLTQDALWHKDAVIYQVHVRTLSDSNGDGVGDLQDAANGQGALLLEFGAKGVRCVQ